MEKQQLPETGFLRLNQIIGDPTAEPPIPAIIPVSKTTWYEGIASGRYPKPVKISERSSAWTVESIRQLIDEMTITSRIDVEGAVIYINRSINQLLQKVRENPSKSEIEDTFDNIVSFLNAALCRLNAKG